MQIKKNKTLLPLKRNNVANKRNSTNKINAPANEREK